MIAGTDTINLLVGEKTPMTARQLKKTRIQIYPSNTSGDAYATIINGFEATEASWAN